MSWLTAVLPWVWSAVLLAAHFVAIIYVLYTKYRNPNEALMWMLIVALLPGAGLVLFLFFGVSASRHVHDEMLLAREHLTDERKRLLGDDLERRWNDLQAFLPSAEVLAREHNRMLDRIFPRIQAHTGNHVEMLLEGVQAYPRMLRDMEQAKVSIRLQSFIFMSDTVGRKFIEMLERKADEGVDVKVLYDNVGSIKSYFSRAFWRSILRRRPNYAFRAFSQVNLFAPWKFQMRNHRKLLIIDGRIAYTGGINISDGNQRFKTVPKSRYIHDLHCRISGPAVTPMAMSFLRDWAYTTRRHLVDFALEEDFQQPSAAGDTTLRVVDSGPGENYEASRDLFYTAASIARESLEIMTPYLVPGQEYINLLCLAAARGVRVTVIVPRKGNHWFVDWAAQASYRELIEHGVEVRLRRGIFAHTKALLVDNRWGFMGSSNCDNRSFRLNFELDFCFEDGRFVDRVIRQFAAERAVSDPVTLEELKKKSLPRRLVENACALAAPIM